MKRKLKNLLKTFSQKSQRKNDRNHEISHSNIESLTLPEVAACMGAGITTTTSSPVFLRFNRALASRSIASGVESQKTRRRSGSSNTCAHTGGNFWQR